MKNIVFIDGQNLYLGTKQENWSIDYQKLYIKENYNVSHIYYFIGYKSEKFSKLYQNLIESGLILIFKEHNFDSFTKIDSDVIFEIMKSIIEDTNLNKIILISGDGDYKKVIDYLIHKNRFEKILFPNKKFVSALYKDLENKYKDFLQNIKVYIEYNKNNP